MKNLVMKGEIFQAGEENPVGMRRITPKRMKRVT
jgi:hypothetical protein